MHRVVMVITVFALLAGFPLAAAEAMWVDGSATTGKCELTSGLCCLFSEQAEGPALLAGSDDEPISPKQTDSQRFLGFWKTGSSRISFYFSQIKTGPKEGFVSIKDTILLKLRI